MVAYDYSPLEVEAILTTLAPMNWVVMGASIVHAGLVFRGSTLSIASGAFFLGSVAWNNWLVASAGLNYSVSATVLATLATMLTQAPLLKPQVRRVILNRGLRWWRTPVRKKAQLQAVVRPVIGGEMKSRTWDISEGGAFISMDKASWDQLQKGVPETLKIGSRCAVRLTLDQMNTIQCGAEIVRHATARGSYPEGFAVRFVNLDSQQKRMLSNYVQASREGSA